jgi:small subunit ribosomal protein S7
MRGKKAPKRKIKPDARFGSVQIEKFINYIMTAGKKSTAQRVVYGAFDLIEAAIKEKKFAEEFKTPAQIFDQAIKNVSPQIEVRGRRVGGANYQVPFPVRGERKLALSFRWIIGAARGKKGKPMHVKLADELIAAFNNEGEAIKKKADVHRMAEANRAFAHFAR